jgi:hypothetical protein
MVHYGRMQMKLDDVREILKWAWKWYPAIWKLIIPDAPFRVFQVKLWRNSWMILTGLASVFGWWKAPCARTGWLACAEISVFGLVGLLFLGWLLRYYPFADDCPLWRPVACVAIYLWAPYLVPMSLHRFDEFINVHWDKSIEWYIPASDPGFTWKDVLINSSPYCLFTLAGFLMIVMSRRMRSAPSIQTGE